jgi:Uma2 family endonuclease
MTATAAKLRNAPRSQRRAGPVSVSLPVPAQGESRMMGLGDWDTYLMLDAALADNGFRVRYHHGQIEIMSVSFTHEAIKGLLHLFIIAYCEAREMDFITWGSTTQRKEKEMGGEPDESYTFSATKGSRPDMILEVALTSGGISKLPFWAEKQIPEVWIWEKKALQVFRFQRGKYVALTESKCLPGFPLKLAEKLVSTEPQSRAVREFRRSIAEGK